MTPGSTVPVVFPARGPSDGVCSANSTRGTHPSARRLPARPPCDVVSRLYSSAKPHCTVFAADHRRAADREDEFVLAIDVKVILGAERKGIEARARGCVRLLQDAIGLRERHSQVWGDELAEGRRNVDLANRWRRSGGGQACNVGDIEEVRRGGNDSCESGGEEG